MIEWLHDNFPHGSNYLIEQEDAEQINNCMSRQLVLPAYVGRKHGLWGEAAQRLSSIGNIIGWVPNKLLTTFFADSVEMEIADACAAREGLLQSNKYHLDQTQEILAHFNFLHFAQRNPYFLSEGETKLLWFLTQWVKQSEYMIIGHLPSSLSKKRTDDVVNFILKSESNFESSTTIILGFVVHQRDWFTTLLKDSKWKISQMLPCL